MWNNVGDSMYQDVIQAAVQYHCRSITVAVFVNSVHYNMCTVQYVHAFKAVDLVLKRWLSPIRLLAHVRVPALEKQLCLDALDLLPMVTKFNLHFYTFRKLFRFTALSFFFWKHIHLSISICMCNIDLSTQSSNPTQMHTAYWYTSIAQCQDYS